MRCVGSRRWRRVSRRRTRRQIAVGLLTRDQIKVIRTSGADARPDQGRIFEEVGDLSWVGAEEAALSASSKPRPELLQPLEGQGSAQSRSNARVDPLDILARGEEQQRPGVVRRERPAGLRALTASRLDRGPLDQPAIADLRGRQLAMDSQGPHPSRTEPEHLSSFGDGDRIDD